MNLEYLRAYYLVLIISSSCGDPITLEKRVLIFQNFLNSDDK